MEQKLTELKNACAAYEAALNYDYCPSVEEAATVPDEFIVAEGLTKQHFIDGAKKHEGSRPDEIANKIISLVASL